MHGKVTVMGSVSQKKVLRAARRTGRLAVLWPSAYNNTAYHHTYAQPPPEHHAKLPAQAQAQALAQAVCHMSDLHLLIRHVPFTRCLIPP